MAETHYPNAAAHGAEEPHDVHHERKDISLAGVLSFAVGLAASVGVILFAVWILFRFYQRRETAAQGAPAYPLAQQQQSRLPPEPRLQINPREDLEDLRDSEEATLNSYGWVDKNAGVVRIPISEAMKLAVQRGLPARPKQP